MKLFVLMSLVASMVLAQALPADIDKESYSRLPFIKRSSLNAEEQKVYDAVIGKDAQGNVRPSPGVGPAATSLYSIGIARSDGCAKQIRADD